MVAKASARVLLDGTAAQRSAWLDGWEACLDYLADLVGGRVMPAHPTDLEVKRWGPGGREHFADPRPGDFPGRM